jgi:tripartite-type tricarboxylate transporter receptor subunit TctC
MRRTALLYDPVLTTLPHVKAGEIRALAAGSGTRSPLLPEVPTVAESGQPGSRIFLKPARGSAWSHRLARRATSFHASTSLKEK